LIGDNKRRDFQPPTKLASSIIHDDAKEKSKVRRVIQDAFGTYFVIDPTSSDSLDFVLPRVHLGNRYGGTGIHDEAVKFHARYFQLSRLVME